MKIIPYVQPQTGMWSVPDNAMVMIYHDMAINKLDQIVFANGTVTNPRQWMMFIQNPKNVVHLVVADEELQMIAWLNCFGLNYAFGHFCAFPCAWGKTSLHAGQMTMRYWFNDLKANGFQLDVVMGQVPAKNKRAIEYVEKLGFTPMGTVPMVKYKVGDSDDTAGAYFCFMTREEI